MNRMLLIATLPLLSCAADRDETRAAVEQRDALASPVVHTAEGAVRGVASGDLVVFHKIPYARPPLGALRFRAPQPAIPWSNPHDRRHRDPRRPLRQAPARRHRAVTGVSS
jgi:Carboxylesterase family